MYPVGANEKTMGQSTGTRLKYYEKTYTSSGRLAHGVWMDQYGRIFEERTRPQFYPNGKRKGKDKTSMEPTGECGVATH